jgi:hypothetical protein
MQTDGDDESISRLGVPCRRFASEATTSDAAAGRPCAAHVSPEASAKKSSQEGDVNGAGTHTGDADPVPHTTSKRYVAGLERLPAPESDELP